MLTLQCWGQSFKNCDVNYFIKTQTIASQIQCCRPSANSFDVNYFIEAQTDYCIASAVLTEGGKADKVQHWKHEWCLFDIYATKDWAPLHLHQTLLFIQLLFPPVLSTWKNEMKKQGKLAKCCCIGNMSLSYVTKYVLICAHQHNNAMITLETLETLKTWVSVMSPTTDSALSNITSWYPLHFVKHNSDGSTGWMDW